jgi:hypothetical protein
LVSANYRPFIGGGVNYCPCDGATTMNQHASLHTIATSVIMIAVGCHAGWKHGFHEHHATEAAFVPNPLFLPVADPEILWGQLLDVLDDDFRVQREDRVRVVGDLMLEGRIETFPTVGSTVLEPWRGDSTRGFERWHATLQSLRRRASVRVIPADGGFLVDMTVHKELEFLNQPENATVERVPMREDGPPSSRGDTVGATAATTMGWIPVGRDVSLEQRLLRALQARLVQ